MLHWLGFYLVMAAAFYYAWHFKIGQMRRMATFMLIGVFMNHVVQFVNGCMPVLGRTRISSDGVHCPMTEGTHLNWLADWIDIPYFGIASPGDAFIGIGMVLAFMLSIRSGRELCRIYNGVGGKNE